MLAGVIFWLFRLRLLGDCAVNMMIRFCTLLPRLVSIGYLVICISKCIWYTPAREYV